MKHARKKAAARSLLTQMAVRRIKKSRETVFLMIGMLLSLFMISFFLFFTVTVREGSAGLTEGLPHGEFVNAVVTGLTVAVVLLSVATLLTVRTWAGLSEEASAHNMAVLLSVGATSAQRRRLMGRELSMLYLPPLFIGTTAGAAIGVASGIHFAGVHLGGEDFLPYALLWSAVLIVGIGLVWLCYTLPRLRIKRVTPSVAESLKRRGKAVSTETHGYRQSKTFREQTLLRRLASKSVDFYKTRYNRLSLSLAVSVFYPILAALLFYHLIGISVTLDKNPFDASGTTQAVTASVMRLFAMIGVGFLLLTVQGVWGAILLIRTQFEHRKTAGRAYVSMGMTERDFRRVMSLELRSLCVRSAVYLLFFVLISNFGFTWMIG